MNNLEARAEEFTKIITGIAMDSDSIVRTAVMFDEMRPIEDADLSWEEAKLVEGTTPEGLFCYEDAGMTSIIDSYKRRITKEAKDSGIDESYFKDRMEAAAKKAEQEITRSRGGKPMGRPWLKEPSKKPFRQD